MFALIHDTSLKNQSCGQRTHLWKYSLLNVVFSIFTTVSFFFFPHGGEGARARALVVTIFHAAFLVWGALMWLQLTDQCSSVLSNQYETIYLFHHVSVFHNAVFFTLMIVHEAFLGRSLGSDFTLMATVEQQPGFNAAMGAGAHNPNVSVPGGMMAPGMKPAPAGAMAPDVYNDYKDIIKSPPGQLPKSEP